MNRNKLKKWITGLKAAPKSIKNTLGTVTTHGELVDLVASDLQELQDCCNKVRKLGGWKKTADGNGTYHFGGSYKLYRNPTMRDGYALDALAMYLDMKTNKEDYGRICPEEDEDHIYDSLNAWWKNDSARYEAVVAHWGEVLNKKGG